MKWLLRPICWARTRFIWPYPVSGHHYVETSNWSGGGKDYQQLDCEVCGHVSISWSES